MRIDERIQQLFGIMNGMLIDSPIAATSTSSSALSTYSPTKPHTARKDSSRNSRLGKTTPLRTFGVIPLSQRLGLLEFMEGTRTLNSIMMASAAESPQQPDAAPQCVI